MFILDEDPIVSASLNCDIHVNKIILEAAQCMCAAHWEHGFPLIGQAPQILQDGKYRGRTHHNNHVTKWVRATKGNYRWAYTHAVELCRQHRIRYRKSYDHASLEIINWLGENEPYLSEGPRTEFTQAIAKDCYHPNAVVAYWTYYVTCKWHLAVWKTTEEPSWYRSLTAKRLGGAKAPELLRHAEELYEAQRTLNLQLAG